MYYRITAGSCVNLTIDLGRYRSTFGESGYTVVELVIVFAIIGVLTAVAIPIYGGYTDRQDRRTAITDIHVLQTAITRFRTEFGGLPNSLDGVAKPGLVDPWGNPYEYLNIEDMNPGDQPRKDKNLVPLNSDYDLYSMGKDGESKIPLTSPESHDDIIRANDGAFVGLAIDY
jgi:general secretion pathway protein G